MPRFAKYDVGEEPIEGYRLLDFLGKGQYGEVWKAVDQKSGKKIAIKIIDLTHSSGALKELRALNQVKNLNHPNLVPIFTARLKDRKDREVPIEKAEEAKKKGELKELVIAMGLGDESLAARLKEINPDGTPPEERKGLPIDELVQYMEGAAKGIDFLNRPDHGLETGDGPVIHCDIKPDNMMIVSGEIQIADCGVAVMITPDARQTRAAGSPAYSPPELTANKPGPGSDQYSLAVSYYELRTGNLPFNEDIGLGGIIIAHSQGDLDFSLVSDEERAVLKKATAIRPKDRYESCSKFIRAVAKAADAAAAARLQATSGTVPVLPPRPLDPTAEARFLSDSGPSGPVAFPQDRPVPAGRSGAVNFDADSDSDGRVQRPQSRPSFPGFGGTDGPTETPRVEMPGDYRGTPKEPATDRNFDSVEMDPEIAALISGRPAAPAAPPPPPPPPPPTTILQPPPPRRVPAPPGEAPAPGRNAIPADPNDPMGGQIRGTVEMDPTIEAIIKGSGPVKLTEPPRPPVPAEPVPPTTKRVEPPRPRIPRDPVPPTAEEPATARDKKKSRPPVPAVPPPESGSQPEPIWLQPAEEAPRKSGPVADKRRSGPVGKKPASDARLTIQPGQESPQAQADDKTWVREALREEDLVKRSGPIRSSWRDSQAENAAVEKKGGGKLLIALGLAAVLGLGGVGAAVVLNKGGKTDGGGGAQKDPDPVPPPTKIVDQPPQVDPNKTSQNDTKPKPVPTAAEKIENAKNNRAQLKALLNDPDAAKPEFRAEWDKAYAKALAADIGEKPRAEALLALKEAMEWDWKENSQNRDLILNAVKAKFVAKTEKRLVFDAVVGLPAAVAIRKQFAADLVVEEWKSDEGPRKKLEALSEAAASNAAVAAAIEAVKAFINGDLLKAAGGAAGDGGVPLAAINAWYSARTSEGVKELENLAQHLAKADAPPPLPAALANEYFRLLEKRGSGIGDLQTLQAVAKRAEGWPELPAAAKDQILDGHKLISGQIVRRELVKPNADIAAIAAEIDKALGENAVGWAAAVKAEAIAGQVLPPKLSAALNAAAAAADPQLAAYASFVKGCGGTGRDAATAFTTAYKDKPNALLNDPKRKARAVKVLVDAAVPKLQPDAAANWSNPYRGSTAIETDWLKTALELADPTDTQLPRVAMYASLAASKSGDRDTASKAAAQAMALVPGKIPDADLVAARAFFSEQADKLRTSNRPVACRAAASGARVAYRLARAGLEENAKDDRAEKAYIQKAFAPIRSDLIAQYMNSAESLDKTAHARLALTDVCLTALDPEDPLAGKKDEVKRLIGVLDGVIGVLKPQDSSVAEAVKVDPDLAEAVGCRAFLTLFGCSKYYGGLYLADDAGSPAHTAAWERLRADATAAITAPNSPLANYFGHISRAYAGMTEMATLPESPYTCPKIKPIEELGPVDIERVAESASAATAQRVTFGMRAAVDTYSRALFLFTAGNQLAKLGYDSARVNRYLQSAFEQSDSLLRKYNPWWKQPILQYYAYNLRGLVREDIAWLVKTDPLQTYQKGIEDLIEAARSQNKENDPKTVVDLFRARVRAKRYAAGPDPLKNADIDAVNGIATRAEGGYKVQARYWLGVAYWLSDKPEEADEAFDGAVSAAEKSPSPRSLEFALLATGLRSRLAMNGASTKKLAALVEKSKELLAVETGTSSAKKPLRDALPFYRFLPDYLEAKRALSDNNLEDAKAAFDRAVKVIEELTDEGRMMVEEPFCILCLADQLDSKAAPSGSDAAKRKALLKKLLKSFGWSVTDAEKARFESLTK